MHHVPVYRLGLGTLDAGLWATWDLTSVRSWSVGCQADLQSVLLGWQREDTGGGARLEYPPCFWLKSSRSGLATVLLEHQSMRAKSLARRSSGRHLVGSTRVPSGSAQRQRSPGGESRGGNGGGGTAEAVERRWSAPGRTVAAGGQRQARWRRRPAPGRRWRRTAAPSAGWRRRPTAGQ